MFSFLLRIVYEKAHFEWFKMLNLKKGLWNATYTPLLFLCAVHKHPIFSSPYPTFTVYTCYFKCIYFFFQGKFT